MYMNGIWKTPYANMRGKKNEEEGLKKYWEMFGIGVAVWCRGLWETEIEWNEARAEAKETWELFASPRNCWVEERPPNILQPLQYFYSNEFSDAMMGFKLYLWTGFKWLRIGYNGGLWYYWYLMLKFCRNITTETWPPLGEIWQQKVPMNIHTCLDIFQWP